ncbi:MAG: 30S ribosomal protein S6 [Planctomycetes bacterium]|nr:30S ribosomal protein S6 [Planctomycetota bacterium]
MPEQQKNYYEGLFLFPQSVTANLQAASDHVKEILQRAEVSLISFKKWDERRLAYEVKGNRRGVFFLVYFEAHGSAIAKIDRDCNLSEQVLRAMITRADNMSLEQMQAADGQEQLAVEIKLRATEEAEAAEKAEKPKEEIKETVKVVQKPEIVVETTEDVPVTKES